MSVGAGSIKRAAASAAKETRKSQKAGADAKTPASAGASAKAPASAKAGAAETSHRKTGAKSAVKEAKSQSPKASGGNESYSVGQALPVYLL